MIYQSITDLSIAFTIYFLQKKMSMFTDSKTGINRERLIDNEATDESKTIADSQQNGDGDDVLKQLQVKAAHEARIPVINLILLNAFACTRENICRLSLKCVMNEI